MTQALNSMLLYVVLVCSVLMVSPAASAQPPNIVFILADDLGWNDVSFHGSQQIPTPNLDTLAYDGILLGNYYVQPICTPTRGSIMTGRHPIHTGLQNGVIIGAEPYGLGLNETIMPQYLKELGYSTHIVGKWHLGFFAKEYTPLYRGFDSHRGYYMGAEDYWDHTTSNGGEKSHWGLDFRRNEEVDKTSFGEYSTEVFTSEAERIIQEHDTSKPLYLYMAHQAIHSGTSPSTPLEAPWKYLKNFDYIKDKNRRTVAAMVSALDDSVGNITKALADHNMLNNTIIVFTTDNGGPAHGFDSNYANNWPLRGVKHTLWEGGVRGPGFVWSPLLKTSGYTAPQMIQVIDWLPSLLSAAGYNMTKLPRNIDGMDQWEILSDNGEAIRTEMLHNIEGDQAALRIRELKIIKGSQQGWDGWYPPEGVTTPAGRSLEVAPPHMFQSSLVDVLKEIGRDPQPRDPLVVNCGPKPANASTNCDVKNKVCLFNITADPCEFNNLAEKLPDDLQHLLSRLEYYKSTAVPPRNKPNDPQGEPGNHGGIWGPWIELTEDELRESSGMTNVDKNRFTYV